MWLYHQRFDNSLFFVVFVVSCQLVKQFCLCCTTLSKFRQTSVLDLWQKIFSRHWKKMRKCQPRWAPVLLLCCSVDQYWSLRCVWSFTSTLCLKSPLPSNGQYLSYDACLEVKREDNQNCLVLCCVRQLCTTIRTQMRAVLTVLWTRFCHTGPISLCVDLFVFCVFLFHTA